jgi:hypothetical protein
MGIVLALAAIATAFLIVSPAGARRDPNCSVSPGQVALHQSWTVSAFGLPTGGSVNLIIIYPNGTTLTGPVSVASDGTLTFTASSANALPAEQTGTYTYQFGGKISWPAGTFKQSYATCSVQVG